MKALSMRVMIKIMAAALVFAMPLAASAKPITYDFYMVTGGSLGGVAFDNALVHFRTQSDTAQAVFYPSLGGQANLWLNTYGTTTVTIMSKGKLLRARITDALFVSLDQNGGGVGLGSYDSTGNFDPTYPIGIQDGIPDCIIGDGDCVNANAQTWALATDLVSSTTLSGRAWSDTCFLTGGGCDGGPLNTTAGLLLIARPYYGNGTDPFVTGIFRATVH